MNSRLLMLLRLDTSATEEIGSTPRGALSIFPVTGGSFEGELLRGKVLAGGGDWVTAKGDETFELLDKVLRESEVIVVGAPHRAYRGLDLGDREVVDIWGITGPIRL